MGSSVGASAGLGRKSAVVGAALVGAPGSRKAGEKVHLCVHCDLPIAIYGLLVRFPAHLPEDKFWKS
jgi:hypothetical protein